MPTHQSLGITMPDRRPRLTFALSMVLTAFLVLWSVTSATAQNNPPSGVGQEVPPTSPVRRPPFWRPTTARNATIADRA